MFSFVKILKLRKSKLKAASQQWRRCKPAPKVPRKPWRAIVSAVYLDGFGPVDRHADDVRSHILSLLDGGEDPSYSLRRRGFFRYHDGKASQRVAERMFEVAGCLMRPELSGTQAEALVPRLVAEGRTDETIRLVQYVLDTGKSASPAFREVLLNGLAEGSDQREFNRRVVQWLSYAMRMEDEILRLREPGASSIERSADHHAKA